MDALPIVFFFSFNAGSARFQYLIFQIENAPLPGSERGAKCRPVLRDRSSGECHKCNANRAVAEIRLRVSICRNVTVVSSRELTVTLRKPAEKLSQGRCEPNCWICFGCNVSVTSVS